MSNYGMSYMRLKERRFYVGNLGWGHGSLDESDPCHGLDRERCP